MNRNFLIYYISRIRKKAGRFIESRLESNGLEFLNSSHGTILSALYSENRPLSMTEISHLIYRNKSTTSQLVQKLLKGGYVKKTCCESDGRVIYISLAEKGMAMEAKFRSISSELIETAYKNFSKEEIDELLRLLKKLSSNFK